MPARLVGPVDEHKKVLNDWFTFFSKRYNIKGKVEGATNT
jgi:membrane-associated progesterone receptor component